MAVVRLILDWKEPSWVIGNADVLDENEIVHLTDGRFAQGDGVTEVQNLTWLGAVSNTATHLISGGGATVGSFGGGNNVRVAAASYYIEDNGSFSSSQTDYTIALSSEGTQRFVAFFGNTSSTVTKVEGTESTVAEMPATPADTVLLGYVLVTDGAVSETPDLSGYLLRADKATKAEAQTGTNDEKYLTPLAGTGIRNPRVSSVVSSATLSLNLDLYDCLSVTALAADVTSVTLSGSFTDFRPVVFRFKSTGVWTVTLGSQFHDAGGGVTFSTAANKSTTVACMYDSVRAKFGVLRIVRSID